MRVAAEVGKNLRSWTVIIFDFSLIDCLQW
jgi:hypothetical protein